ncbi:MAG: DUF6731 family protein [Gallionellaceae bacterium]
MLLDELLEQILNTDLVGRERMIGKQPFRLEDAVPPTKTSPFWLLDLSKRRYEGGPGKASKDTPVKSFKMGAGFGFAEETAALFDPYSGFVIVQYNHYGPRAGAIAEYFSSYDLASPNFYEFQLQLSPNAQARLNNKKVFTRIKLTVAPAMLTDAYRKNNISLVNSLSAQLNEFGGDTVSIEVSLNRGSNTSLKIRNKLKALLCMANEEQDAVSAMVITGRDDIDQRLDPVDLIHERLETPIKDMPLDEGLRYPKEARFLALQRAYNGWKKDKIIS